MSDITLYTVPQSRGTYVRWMLEECQASYDVVALDFESSIKSADYLAINPMGKVPALRHREHTMTEMLAIITYLAEIFPEHKMIPAAGTPERGQFYRWMCFALHLEYAAVDKRRGITTQDGQQRRAIGYGDFDTAFNTLRKPLGSRQHLIGDHFTALDLYYSALLGWLTHVAKVLPADDPVFGAFMTRHMARPALVRTRQLEEEQVARPRTR
ncbi:MAG: glutathione S-transferase family protein [Lautropia sp.]|nr:glutathione S-transferase family protein [Lautropia sp.]